MVIRIRIPAPSSMLLANVLAVLSLAAVIAGIGGLAGAWWAVLAGGVLGLVVAYAAMMNAAAAEQAAPAAAGLEHQAPVDEHQAVPERWRAAEEPAAA
jgi:succinate-acetate transporter protein